MLNQWRYRLEKGRPHLLLLAGLLLLLIGLSVVGGFVVFITGTGGNLWDSIWWTFLHLSDPGYLGDDDTPISAILGTLFTVLGMIIFVAGIVGILTSMIASGLKNLHEGGAPVAFSDHIVIVGWNTRVFTLVADLLHASTRHQIAILAPLVKEDAEKQLERRVFDPIAQREGRRAAHIARGNVVYRQGHAGVDHDLNRVSAGDASRFILLAEQSGVSVRAVDVAQIRTLYSIERAHVSPDAGAKRFATVVEFTSEQFRSHAFYAMRVDPRRDAWVNYYEEQLEKRGLRSYLPVPGELKSLNDMTAVNPDQIVSRVLVQCAVQPFLSGIYDELFSFQGREMFLWQPDRNWQDVWHRMLEQSPASRPVFLSSRMQEGLVMGIFRDGEFSFDPADWSALDDNTQYLVLGDQQAFSRRPLEGVDDSYPANCGLSVPSATPDSRVLILGVNRRFTVVIEQLADYIEQYAGHRLTIDVLDENDLPDVATHTENINLNLHRGDYTSWETLGSLLEEQPAYDSIILLAEDLHIDDPEVDARVTLVLVMLRAFRDDFHWQEKLEHTSLVAEVRDPRNRNILRQKQLAGDVIVGDEYVSGFIAQICVDPRLEELYREILDYGQYEVYARDVATHEAGCAFGSLVQACAERGETAMGILQKQADDSMVTLLAPGMETIVGEGDQALVIARE